MEKRNKKTDKQKLVPKQTKSNNKKSSVDAQPLNEAKQLSDLAERFNNGLQSLRNSISALENGLELLGARDDITIEDDERINELLDSSYRYLDDVTGLTDNIYYFVITERNEKALSLYNEYLDVRNDLTKIKEKASDLLSKKWRENVYKQQRITNDLLEELRSQNNETSSLRNDVLILKNENDELYKNLSASQRNIADSSNRFITIVALLVSLLAIIFGNIIQFTKTDLSWQSVIIVNASILLSSCIIFTIIENVHLISLKGFQSNDAENRIQLSFNIIMFVIVLILSAVLVCSVFSLSNYASTNISSSEESSSIEAVSAFLLLDLIY